MGSSNDESSKLRVGMVGGGGPANFFGAPHRRAILMDNSAELTAGALRSKPDESIASAKELFFARGYGDWQGDDRTPKASTPRLRADRLRDDRHPQRRPFRARRGRREGRDRRPLREAPDDHARRGEGGSFRRPSRRHKGTRSWSPTPIPASRWSCSRRDPGRTTARSARSARSRRGIRRGGWRRSWRPRGRSRRPGGSTRPRSRAPRAAAATSARTPTSSSSFVGGCSERRRSRRRLKTFVAGPGPRRRLHRPGRAGQRRRSRRSPPRRSPSAPRTTTASASPARPARSSGTITDHNILKHSSGGQPVHLYRQGAEYGYIPASIKPYMRLPSGHPEGFHEALANLHRTLEWTIRGPAGREPSPTPFDHPGIADGVAGMAFIEAAVASSKQEGAGSRSRSRRVPHGRWLNRRRP